MLSLRQNLWELLRLIGDGTSWQRRLEMLDSKPHERGAKLLKTNLTMAQREQYERRGYIEVTGGATGRRYRIHHGLQMNVEELNAAGAIVRVMCFLPEGRLPVGDVMLAQKIALELFELEALKIANTDSPIAQLSGLGAAAPTSGLRHSRISSVAAVRKGARSIQCASAPAPVTHGQCAKRRGIEATRVQPTVPS